MATDHTVKLTLDQLVEVRSTLQQSRDLTAKVLGDKALHNEHLRKGPEGRAEWKQMEERCALLDQILGRL